VKVEPGMLRRFHDDAFFANERHLNGRVFVIVEVTPDDHIAILVDGTLDEGWGHHIIEDHSEVIDEAG
jgi:hypothetical protein